jgi:uncharacterized membrane protein YdbT with pleckstrin-like domain
MAEEIIWKGGRSPLSLLRYWTIGILTLPLLGLGIIIILLGVYRMYKKRYYVTSERVKTEVGFLSRTTRDAELNKIQDTYVKQSILGRVFNYGDLFFSTAGSSGYEITFHDVPNPEGLKATIREINKKK